MTIWPAWQHYEEKTKGSIEVGKLADFVILSRDPTKGDVNTIDRIKVTETIKEGATIFRLTAEEQRKADLMLKPDRHGHYAFANAMRAIAVHDEYERLPAFMQQPAVLQHMAAMPHDATCLLPVIDRMVAAMVGAEGSSAR
jgi:hypothetical protein